MNFHAGPVSLPKELLLSGMSGNRAVQPPEQPRQFSRISDEALVKLARDLLVILDNDPPTDERQAEYVMLLAMQAQGEICRRAF